MPFLGARVDPHPHRDIGEPARAAGPARLGGRARMSQGMSAHTGVSAGLWPAPTLRAWWGAFVSLAVVVTWCQAASGYGTRLFHLGSRKRCCVRGPHTCLRRFVGLAAPILFGDRLTPTVPRRSPIHHHPGSARRVEKSRGGTPHTPPAPALFPQQTGVTVGGCRSRNPGPPISGVA